MVRISISAELGDAWTSVCEVSRDVVVRAKTHSLDEGVRRLAEIRCRDSGKRYKNPNGSVALPGMEILRFEPALSAPQWRHER